MEYVTQGDLSDRCSFFVYNNITRFSTRCRLATLSHDATRVDPGRKHRLKCVAAPAPWAPARRPPAHPVPVRSTPCIATPHTHTHARALARAAAVPAAPHPAPVVACIGQLRAVACAVKCLQPPRTAASACHSRPGGGLAERPEAAVCGRQEADGGMRAGVRGQAYLIALDCSPAAASNVEGRRHHPMKSSSDR